MCRAEAAENNEREKPCRIISQLFGGGGVYIVQRSFCIRKDERDTASKFPFCPAVYSGWSL